MSLEYARGSRLWLKDHPDYREAWLRDLIARDPSILGLGTLQVRQVERPVPGSGRLDLLLQNHQHGRRYVVEVMLGRMDESHIIRCIEYWDFEQRRSPRYVHCAVLIAEEVQARFQNVLLLLHRVMPVIALELCAIQMGNKLVVHFAKLLDLRQPEAEEEPTCGRCQWERRGVSASLGQLDQCLALLREIDPAFEPVYYRDHIGIAAHGKARNFLQFRPMKHCLRMELRTRNLRTLHETARLEEFAAVEADRRWRNLRLLLADGDVLRLRPALKRLLQSAYEEYRLKAGSAPSGAAQLPLSPVSAKPGPTHTWKLEAG